MSIGLFIQTYLKRHYLHEPFWRLWNELNNLEKRFYTIFSEELFYGRRLNNFLKPTITSLAEIKSAVSETSASLPDNHLKEEAKTACKLLNRNIDMISTTLKSLEKDDEERIQIKDISFEKFRKELLFASVQITKTETAVRRCMQNRKNVQMQ